MKVLLIYPPTRSLYGLPRFPMVGLTYLGTVLQNKGIEVEVLDMRFPHNNFSVLKKLVKSFRPKVAGVGSATFDFPGAKKVFSTIKKIDPSIVTVLGGPHANVCPDLVLKEENVDHIFIGEGEEEFPKFLQKKTRKPKIINAQHSFIKDLDSLPFPRWELFPLNEYRVRGKLTLPILTSRGCPYNCIYCASWRTHGKKFRFRSPKNVVDEIERDIREYGVTDFSIVDDNFALDIQRAYDICQEIIRRKLKINWNCDQGMRADRTNRKLFKIMKKSGCRLVAIGVEHVDQEILDNMRKGELVETIKKSIADAKAAGLIVKAFFIVGGPGDNLGKTKKSIRFFKKTGVDIPRFSMMTAYPGSAMWDWVEANGKFLGDPLEHLFKKSPGDLGVQFETKDFPKKERIKAFQLAEKEAEIWLVRQKLIKKIGPLTFLVLPILYLDQFRNFLKSLYRLKLLSATD